MIITVKQSDLVIRPFRGSGPGGQHRNTTMSSGGNHPYPYWHQSYGQYA